MRNLRCFLGAVLSFLFMAEAGAANFIHLDTITASDAAAQDRFGGPTALSQDGSTLLVTAPRAGCATGPDCGAVYVFVREPGGWVQQAKLTVPDPAPLDHFFGLALSGDGNLALVGAGTADCAAGADCGAVYVFVRNGTLWSFQQKLTASDASAGDTFGLGLDLSSDGTIALVGAFRDNCEGGSALSACGSVYAFERTGNVWTEKQKLRGAPAPNTFFGSIVKMSRDGNTALIVGDVFGGVVAARAYVFTRSGGVWSFQAKLAPLGSPFAFAFAMDLSGDGNIAFIYEEAFNAENSVYVFTRTGTAWSLETRLTGNLSGSSFALSGDGQTAVVTSPNTCTGTCPVAQVIHRDQGTWTVVQPLFVTGLSSGGVNISGDARTVLIGDSQAPCASGPSCGAAHLFGVLSPLEDVPTVSQLGLALLALLLAASGARVLARRRRSS